MSVHYVGKSGNTASSSSTASRTIKFEGTLKDPNLRQLREENRVAFIKELRRLGFAMMPEKRNLEGKWSWRWTDGISPATVIFDFKSDLKMDAKLVPDRPKDWPGNGLVTKGWGTWSLEEGVLRVNMEKVGIWPGIPNQVTFIDSREITWFDEGQIILAGSKDKVLVRQ